MICPNCNQETEGNYCSNCGQKNHLHKETFWNLIGHFLGHYFHFESKFWSSFRVLLTQPGKLTQAYQDKKRMRFVPPINLYIFSSVFFFIIVHYTVKVGFVTEVQNKIVNKEGKMLKPRAMYPHYVLALGRYRYKEIDKLKEKYPGTTALFMADSVGIRQWVSDINSITDNPPPLYKMLNEKFTLKGDYIYVNYFIKYLLPIRLGETHNYFDLDQPFADFATEYFHLLPKLLFFLMPLLGFFILIGFKKQGFLYVDHTIMSLHTHIFMFACMAVHFILGCFINLSYFWCLVLSAIILPGIYFLLALHKFYKFSWLRTTLVGSLIWVIYMALLFCFSIVVSVIIFRYFE